MKALLYKDAMVLWKQMKLMLLLILIWLFDLWGFIAGVLFTLVLIVSTKPLVGRGYLYPLIPFDRKKLKHLLYRCPISRDNS